MYNDRPTVVSESLRIDGSDSDSLGESYTMQYDNEDVGNIEWDVSERIVFHFNLGVLKIIMFQICADMLYMILRRCTLQIYIYPF